MKTAINALSSILELAKGAKNVVVASHVLPDGDAIGSTCGLATMMEKLFRRSDIVMFNRDAVPDRFGFVPKAAKIVNKAPDAIDFLFVVDCNHPSRLGDSSLVERAKTVVNIDHHPDNTEFGDYNFVDADAAATSHVIARNIIDAYGFITPWAAACFYTGISTDTGGLQFGNLTAPLFDVVGYLSTMADMADFPVTEINRLLWQENPVDEFLAFGQLTGRTQFTDDGVAYLSASASDLTPAEQKAVPKYIRQLLALKGVRVAMTVFNTEDGGTAYSLRGKGAGIPNLGEIARKHNGGGHPLAAGGYVKDPDIVHTLAGELLADVRKELQ